MSAAPCRLTFSPLQGLGKKTLMGNSTLAFPSARARPAIPDEATSRTDAAAHVASFDACVMDVSSWLFRRNGVRAVLSVRFDAWLATSRFGPEWSWGFKGVRGGDTLC